MPERWEGEAHHLQKRGGGDMQASPDPEHHDCWSLEDFESLHLADALITVVSFSLLIWRAG
jgi:hypothetical protein